MRGNQVGDYPVTKAGNLCVSGTNKSRRVEVESKRYVIIG